MFNLLSVKSFLLLLPLLFPVSAAELWQRNESLSPLSATLTEQCSKTFALAEPLPSQRALFVGDCEQGNWQRVAPFALPASELFTIDGVLIAYSPEFWQSLDDGHTWTKVSALEQVTAPPFLAADQHWYVQSTNGLYRFDALNKHWLAVELAAFDHDVEQVIKYAVDASSQVYALVFLSERLNNLQQWQVLQHVDAEQQWQVHSPALSVVHESENFFWPTRLFIAPDNTFWVGSQFSFLKRFDTELQQWHTIAVDLPGFTEQVGVLQMHFAPEGIYVLSGEPQIGSGGVLFSADNGNQWQDLTAELGVWQKYPMRSMQFSATGQLSVFAGARGFYKRQVGGEAWYSLDPEIPLKADYVFTLPNNSILALARGDGWGPYSSFGVWRSDDMGASWYSAERGLVDKNGSFKGVTQNAQGEVFVSGYYGAVIFKYLPQLNQWQLVSRNEGQFYTLGSLTSFADDMIGGAYFGGAWRYSLQTGQWQQENAGLPWRVNSETSSGISSIVATNTALLALALDQTSNEGIYVKAHQASAWQRLVNQPEHISALLKLYDGRVLAVADYFTDGHWQAENYVTADEGQSWQPLPPQITGVVKALADHNGNTALLTEDRQGYPYRYRVYLLDSANHVVKAYQVPERIVPAALHFATAKELHVFTAKGFLALDLTINAWSLDTRLTQDMVVNGDLYLNDGELDLNGFTLTVTGSLFQAGGVIRVNGGHLRVLADYKLQRADNVAGNGKLVMTSAQDRVSVGGDFVMDSALSHQGLLTNGVLEVAGNFYQNNSASTSISQYNFATSGNHTVRLTGLAPVVSFASAYRASQFWHLSVTDFGRVQFVTDYYVRGTLLYWLSVSHNGGSSMVLSNDQRLHCGEVCSADYPAGTRIALTYQPSAGYRFSSWQGACSGSVLTCEVTISQGTAVSAAFEPLYANVKVLAVPGLILSVESYQVQIGEPFTLSLSLEQGYKLGEAVTGSCSAGSFVTPTTYRIALVSADCELGFAVEKRRTRSKLPFWLLVLPKA